MTNALVHILSCLTVTGIFSPSIPRPAKPLDVALRCRNASSQDSPGCDRQSCGCDSCTWFFGTICRGAESVAVRRGVSRGHWHDVGQTGTYSLCTKREIVIMVDGKPV